MQNKKIDAIPKELLFEVDLKLFCNHVIQIFDFQNIFYTKVKNEMNRKIFHNTVAMTVMKKTIYQRSARHW
jgi:hypothetical protein